jgi:hypothetical protein
MKSPHCDSAITKYCFINGHFDWCINHQYVANYDRDEDSCFHEDAVGNRFCSVVHCGRLAHRVFKYKGAVANHSADYSLGEWAEEEFTELLDNQMEKESP